MYYIYKILKYISLYQAQVLRIKTMKVCETDEGRIEDGIELEYKESYYERNREDIAVLCVADAFLFIHNNRL